jgi:hypothetical protein
LHGNPHFLNLMQCILQLLKYGGSRFGHLTLAILAFL